MRERNLIMRLVILALMLYALGSFVSAGRELARQRADTRALEIRRQELLVERRELEAQLTAADDAGDDWSPAGGGGRFIDRSTRPASSSPVRARMKVPRPAAPSIRPRSRARA